LSVVMSYCGSRLEETLVLSLRHDAFQRIERLSMLSVFSQGPGEFVQKLGRDVFQVREVIEDTLLRSSGQVAAGITVFISMLVLDPVLTLSLMVGFLLMGFAIRLINRRIQQLAGVGRELEQEITGTLVENVGGYRDIVASGKFQHFASQFHKILDRAAKIGVKTSVWGQAAGLVPWVFVSLATMGVYYFGVREIKDVSQIGAVITYAALLSQLFPAVLAATQWTSSVAVAMPSMLALQEILELPERVGPENQTELQAPIESIVFDRVSLDIDGRPIIEDMSFEIPGGKFTAIVGQSGSGKTTVFHLLLRLLEPTSGTVLLNGQPLESYTLSSLRSHIGFIPQRPFIFNQSLRDNLLMASPEEISDEKLNDAVELSQLSEVVELWRDQGGLDAVAGYLGNRLSGGEQQRIALARLVLQDPEVIVCDEYTANIDVKTARIIHDAMRDRFRDRTRVVITHELYTIQGADHIIVLDQGRTVDSSTHEELISRPGLYRILWEVQTLK
ncbi:MAG: ABC transporter ATP-binding protein, partial [Planctomycetes bacterium]|nr:ABC transporter ATP-binding protein [Planctomycetota bacterium]